MHVSDALLDYAQALIARTRERTDLKLGSLAARRPGTHSRRPGLELLAGRGVLPEDIQAVLPAVVAHRLERRESGWRTATAWAIRATSSSERCPSAVVQ